jgi:MFS family permease
MNNNSLRATTPRKDPYRWTMLFLIWWFHVLITSYAASSLSYLMPSIMAEFGWSKVQIGAVQSAIQISLIALTFAAGALMDKYRVKVIMALSLVICGIAILLRGAATSFAFFYITMLLLGVGMALYFPGLQKIVGLWFDRTEVYKANGILTTGAAVGMILAWNTSARLADALGSWRNVFYLLGAVILVYTILWLLAAKEKKNIEAALASEIKVTKEEEINIWENIKAVLTHPQVWVLCLAEFFFLGALWAGNSFGPTVLQTDPSWKLSKEIAGLVPTCGNIGSAIGYFVLPILSDRIGLRKPVAVPATFITAFCWGYAYLSRNFTLACILYFIGGFCNGATIPAPRTMAMEQPEIGGIRTATVVGLIQTCQRVGILVLTLMIGGLMDLTGKLVLPMAINYMVMMSIAGLMLLLAKETGWKARAKTAATEPAA